MRLCSDSMMLVSHIRGMGASVALEMLPKARCPDSMLSSSHASGTSATMITSIRYCDGVMANSDLPESPSLLGLVPGLRRVR